MTEPLQLRRGELVWVNCEPSVGAESRKLRTCVVVSNDIANQFGQTVTVVPTQKFSAERNGRAYMVDLSPEVEEAAKIDGASPAQTFWKIILPMCRPILVSAGLPDAAADGSALEEAVASTRAARQNIVGTPEMAREQIAAYAEAGVQELMLQWLDLDDIAGLRAFAQTVLPSL